MDPPQSGTPVADTIIKTLKVVSGRDNDSTAQVTQNQDSSFVGPDRSNSGSSGWKSLASSNNEYSSEPKEPSIDPASLPATYQE